MTVRHDDQRPAFDWRRARAGLKRSLQMLETSGTRDARAERRILRERARRLAQPVTDPSPAGEAIDLLLVSLGDTQYGIEVFAVAEVIALGEVTPLPGVPSFVLGLVNHRGRVLSVVDLHQLVGATAEDGVVPKYAAVLRAEGRMVAATITDVHGVIHVREDRIAAAASIGAAEGTPALVRGVTEAMVGVIDVARLMASDRLAIDEDSG